MSFELRKSQVSNKYRGRKKIGETRDDNLSGFIRSGKLRAVNQAIQSFHVPDYNAKINAVITRRVKSRKILMRNKNSVYIFESVIS